MAGPNLSLPVSHVSIDVAAAEGPLEVWRHALGHGGVNSLPLPERVVQGVRKLQPRLIRIFIQEFFSIYRGPGRFDWSKLDPYMDSMARTGAKVVAAITIKPLALFPDRDPARWLPRDEGEWQRAVAALVRRYSVERPIVTHWEVGNEPDIGEDGGCPYLITDPEDYGRYYSLTAQAVLDAFPEAKVGGPAVASIHSDVFSGLIRYCARTGAKLDFVSWHVYANPPSAHGDAARYAQKLFEGFPGPRPEMLVTEWNMNVFSDPSVEDAAFEPWRSAGAGAAIIEMINEGLDWSFYYHIWDQVCFPHDFAPFATPRGVGIMVRHWNEVPHRLGLFGVGGEVRPQYFVYQMLSRLGHERLAARSGAGASVLAGRATGRVSVLAVNYGMEERCDRVAVLRFTNLTSGLKRLTVWRIDERRMWRDDTLELEPTERRDVWTEREFECQVLLPADSVAMARLEDARAAGAPTEGGCAG